MNKNTLYTLGMLALGAALVQASEPATSAKNGVALNPVGEQSHVQYFGKEMTLRINRDLFLKGVEFKAPKYGSYFANLETSNLLELRHDLKIDSKAPSKTIVPSAVTGGLRVGSHVMGKSKVYLKVGFESENVGAKNMLAVPGAQVRSLGNWRTAIQPGLGVEHPLSSKVSLMGELKTSLTSSDKRSSHYSESSHSSRNSTVLFGIKYHFGE